MAEREKEERKDEKKKSLRCCLCRRLQDITCRETNHSTTLVITGYRVMVEQTLWIVSLPMPPPAGQPGKPVDSELNTVMSRGDTSVDQT